MRALWQLGPYKRKQHNCCQVEPDPLNLGTAEYTKARQEKYICMLLALLSRSQWGRPYLWLARTGETIDRTPIAEANTPTLNSTCFRPLSYQREASWCR